MKVFRAILFTLLVASFLGFCVAILVALAFVVS